MAEYIEREATLEAAKKSHLYFDLKPIIKSIPAAGVQPVVRGKWVHHGIVCGLEKCNCSLCGWHSFKRTNFCPNCGADMRGEQDV